MKVMVHSRLGRAPTRNPRRVLATLGLATVAPLALGAASAGAARAATTTTSGSTSGLGVYSLFGDASGFITSEDEPSANAHPEGQMSVPEAASSLRNGPVGYGIGTVGWPGATVGNVGGVVLLLWPPATVTNVVPIPEVVNGLVEKEALFANDPVRAEAHTGPHPDGAFSEPGIDLTAHADAAKVEATANLQGAEQPGQASYGNARAHSISTLEGNVGKVTATSLVTNVDIGGVVKIGSVSSAATAQTNGLTSSGKGSTLVSGLTIAGQDAFVDDHGVHIGSVGAPANAIANQAAQAALSGAGIQIIVSQPRLEHKAAASNYTAGSVVIVWAPPGDKSANVFVVSLGGARAAVDGRLTNGFAVPVLPTATDSSTGASNLGPTDQSNPIGSLDAGAAGSGRGTSGLGSSPSTPATGGTAGGTGGRVGSALGARGARTTTLGNLRLARTFGGFAWGWLLVAAAVAGLGFAGARRLADDLLVRPGAGCPLENGRP